MSLTRGRQLINQFLQNNGNLTLEQEKKLVSDILSIGPEMAPEVIEYYLRRAHQYKAKLDELSGELKAINDSPWFPARCLRVYEQDPPMVLVTAEGGRRALVPVGEEVDINSLNAGTPVLLNQRMNMVVRVFDRLPVNGEVAVFDRMLRDRMVVKTSAEGEMVLDICAALREAELHAGDPILFDRGSRLALEIIPKPEHREYFLENTPQVTFDDIGGLDDVIQELTEFIDLHFFHQEVVRAHRLRPAQGILLVGRPGLGKTMLAKAVANYCAAVSNGEECKFMNIPAGSQRHWLYGSTEHRYRQIFATAREALNGNGSNRVVMFWDEIDNLGSRGNGFGSEIDSRTMDALLYEMDSLESAEGILCIGATNREDLLDPALKRPKRFGDRIFRIRPPDREACADIFSRYLRPDLPFYQNGRKAKGEVMAEEIIEAAVTHLFAPNSPRARIATITYRSGEKQNVSPAAVISGAIIENAVRRASHASCIRALEDRGGITREDVLNALDDELDSIAGQLKNIRTLRNYLEIPADMDVVKVEAHTVRPETGRHYYLRDENV